MVVARRGSVSGGVTQHYVEHQSTSQIQKTIQTLRLKTQEELSETRDLIASLEESIEMKQMHIEEMERELKELKEENEEHENSFVKNNDESGGELPGGEHVSKPVTYRRWSLAAGFVGLAKPLFSEDDGTTTNNDFNGEYRLEKLKDADDEPKRSEAPTNRRMSLLGFKSPSAEDMLGASSRVAADFDFDFGYTTGLAFGFANALTGTVQNNKSETEVEEDLMKKLHDLQEDNKKLIHQHETNLQFKQEQVTALQLASDAQQENMYSLEQKLSQIELIDVPSPPPATALHRVQSNMELDDKNLQERHDYLQEKTQHLLGDIRRMKKIQNMTPAERSKLTTEMKDKIIETAKRIQSSKMMFGKNKEILTANVEENLREWNLIHTQISLMRRVSEKQLKRLQKKIYKQGSPQELQQLFDRATRALEEEMEMRDNDHVPPVSLVQSSVTDMTTLANTMFLINKSFTQGLGALLNKHVSEKLGDAILTTVEKMEKSIDAAKETIESTMDVLEDTQQHVYEKDHALLSDQVLEEFEMEQQLLLHDDDDDNASDTDLSTSNISFQMCVDTEYNALETKNKLLDYKLKEAKTQNTKGKLADLRAQYQHNKLDWEQKDKKISDVLAEITSLKEREQILRELMNKTRRSRKQHKNRA